jgi:hypothetical protein
MLTEGIEDEDGRKSLPNGCLVAGRGREGSETEAAAAPVAPISVGRPVRHVHLHVRFEPARNEICLHAAAGILQQCEELTVVRSTIGTRGK